MVVRRDFPWLRLGVTREIIGRWLGLTRPLDCRTPG